MDALVFTSKSMGKLTPKLSASVKASLRKPLHCLVTLPTCAEPSNDMTLNSISEQHSIMHPGPSMRNTGLLFSSRMSNFGAMQGVPRLQDWMTYPIGVPGGACTSISCRLQGVQQHPQRRGRY